jgi:DNA processing protein
MIEVQKTARQRASLYFSILEAVQNKTKVANELWDRLTRGVEPTMAPALKDAEGVVGRFSVGTRHFAALYAAVSKPVFALPPEVWISEIGDPDYPPRLADTEDAPTFIFMKGRLNLLRLPALAVVGTRKPSEEGRRRAYKLGYLLAKRGVVVASGLALGIDAAAHEGALRVGGDTIAVIGTPIETIYPKEHLRLQEVIGVAGLLVSQFHPASKVRRYNFPMRNAVMSGLCLGTVVVEASETSGALIQARKCLQQGRRLFIPKSAVDNPALSWPKNYLKRGAIEFSSIEEILEPIDSLTAQSQRHSATTPVPFTKLVCLQR